MPHCQMCNLNFAIRLPAVPQSLPLLSKSLFVQNSQHVTPEGVNAMPLCRSQGVRCSALAWALAHCRPFTCTPEVSQFCYGWCSCFVIDMAVPQSLENEREHVICRASAGA